MTVLRFVLRWLVRVVLTFLWFWFAGWFVVAIGFLGLGLAVAAASI